MTPGRKLSITTCALAASFFTTAMPSADLRSSAIERLPRLNATEWAQWSPFSSPSALPQSPSGGSILMTSAPCNASSMEACGPAMPCVKSRTVMPS